MKNLKSSLSFLCIALSALSCNSPAHQTETPEPEPYVASETFNKAFEDFRAAADGIGIHQVTVVRHGSIVGEAYFADWTPEKPHQLWSTSKTFTSLAVGFAIQDGLLSLDTKLSSIFPDETAAAAVNCPTEERLSHLMDGTIENYLIMACGHAKDATFKLQSDYGASSSDLYVVTDAGVKKGHNILADFFAFQFLRQPGTEFVYDSISTYVLSAAVQKVTGKKIVDYLDEKLFSRIGVEKPHWDEVQGINCGGWGLFMNTRDMVKVGMAMLNAKKYYGSDLIPLDYLKKATSYQWNWKKSVPATLSGYGKRAYNDGYGYQIWLNADAFYSKGMMGQYIYVLPEYDVTIAVTSNMNADDMPTNLIWQYLVPVFESEE